MKMIIVLSALICNLTGAFVISPSAAVQPLQKCTTKLNAYVPDGLSAAEYKAIKDKEKKQQNLGKKGVRGYKSRSFNAFVAALEKGEATHLLPVDPRKVKSGEIPLEEVPYMQRPGGAWDGSDLKGLARLRANQKQKQGMYTAGKWTDADKKYDQNNDKLNSFFAPFFQKQEDISTRAKKNGVSKDTQLWRDAGALTPAEIKRQAARGGVKLNEKKKVFGLF
mmetsp:Transcript_2668/g.4267  ORF Transcript_2668/g.4267 Transcript_2668/m.4267 type:complete len:222 (+) Transcript_2668:183-848(+)|eukprot:CAMPEP_0197310410 /NCGR_PEP_ID=MMETSP0891-20130614/8995_1 /TAXON_ID=44058 ORGANISM="Aureoumbra lagunensis, Strain CCMP1510" /NCGR_SAMPLE_ID=MMETSP0891 /ASSEMBLY_ACC=CAM_ASM_000534 /LENGTH=221 /DNA_ID=CAMNT_0042796031 /DNA_START=88 /DNA_END=753 /DNA_ORIENTATION=+